MGKKRRKSEKRRRSIEGKRAPLTLDSIDGDSPPGSSSNSPQGLTKSHIDPQHRMRASVAERDEPSALGKQTPLLKGVHGGVCPTLEFVYPRSHSPANLVVPYIFDRQKKRQEINVAISSRERDDVMETAGRGRDVPVSSPLTDKRRADETILDILYGTMDSEEHNASVKPTTTNQAASKSAETPETPEKEKGASVGTKGQGTPENPDSEPGHLSGLSVEDVVRDKHGCRPRANSTDFELKLPRRGLCDERSILECFRWKDVNVRCRPRGFLNCGNTCFLNATLQCLAYLPPFAQCLLSLPRSSTVASPKSSGQRMTQLLSALFRQVHGIDQRHGQSDAISPRAIVKAVPTLGSGGSRNGYKFRPGRQEDAHEFLVHLLDAIHDGELKAAGINQESRGWRDKLPIQRLDETTFVHRIFGGYLRSQVRCTKCGHRSNTYDPFLDLALEVSKKSCNTVSEAFAEFTKRETLDSENRWVCSGCQKPVRATKQLTVFRGPLALCVQLKRFTFGGGLGGFSYGGGGFYGLKGASTMTGRGSKITKPVDFPSELRLPLSDGRNCEYGLTGIVVHVGGSSSSGHYTAFVKRPARNVSNRSDWYRMDDSFVEPISEKAVLRHRDAYLLFYCRKEVKLEFPSPPPRASMSSGEARELGAARARARADRSARGEEAGTSELSLTGGSLSPNHTSEPNMTERQTKCSQLQPSTFISGATGVRLHSIDDAKKSSSQSLRREDFSRDVHIPVLDEQQADSVSSSESSSASDSKDEVRLEETRRAIDVQPTTSLDQTCVDTKERILSPKTKSKEIHRRRVVVDRGSTMGRLEVMIGPRYKSKKAWKPASITSSERKGQAHDLLGTYQVGTWGDEEHEDNQHSTTAKTNVDLRESALKEMSKDERSRKRKMYLDRWDAMLDEGKRKKNKKKSNPIGTPEMATPEKNAFQRIQSSIQKMNRGRAKGTFRRKMDTTTRNRRQKRGGRASF